MAIKQVIANKRCLMIRPYELSSINIGLFQYNVPLDGTNPDNMTFPYKGLYTLTGITDKEDICILSLCGYKSLNGKFIYKNLSTQNTECIYNYESDKFTLNVITSSIQNFRNQSLGTYFINKKVYKILNIYLDDFVGGSPTSPPTGTIKIYYLQKN